MHLAAWNVLPLLHSLSPWSEAVLQRLQLPVDHLPAGAGALYEGWPRWSLAERRAKGLGRTVRNNMFPAPWWLRIYYGEGRRVLATGGPGWRTSAG